MYFDGDFAYVLVLCLAVACVMMLAGVYKNTLEWKRPTRTCPSCRRQTARCRCGR
jgi:hypothetical protein